MKTYPKNLVTKPYKPDADTTERIKYCKKCNGDAGCKTLDPNCSHRWGYRVVLPSCGSRNWRLMCTRIAKTRPDLYVWKDDEVMAVAKEEIA